MQPYVPVYRKLLARALKATWFHRGLWFFGFLAGLVQTGAVTNDVLRLAPTLRPGAISWETLGEAWNAFTFGKTLLSGLMTATTEQLAATVIYTLGAAVILILLILSAQHVLLMSAHRAAANKKPLHWREISRELKTVHVGRLLSLDILAKLAVLIVLLGGGLALRELIAAAPEVAGLAAFAMYMLLLPIAFTTSAVAMLALIKVTRSDMTALAGLHAALRFVGRHWLAATEFAAALFIVNFFFTGMLIVGLVLLSQVLVAVFAASIASASLLVALFAVSAVIVVAFIVAIGGAMTTFNYCAWSEFVEKFVKTPMHPRIEHAAAWLRKTIMR